MKKRTSQAITVASLAGVLGLAVLYFQVEEAVDIRTTTEPELVLAFEAHDIQDVQPLQRAMAVSDRRWARQDFNHYVEKICIFRDTLSEPEMDDFDDALRILGYFPWKGCEWAVGPA